MNNNIGPLVVSISSVVTAEAETEALGGGIGIQLYGSKGNKSPEIKYLFYIHFYKCT